MKATELMIGDWVIYNPNVFIEDEYTSQRCYPSQIINGEDIDLACESCYEPIPLTAEILTNNGFENERRFRNEYSIDGTNFYVVEFDNTYSYQGTDMDFKYVHELQHALRLCGLNELANNFKI